MVRPITFTVKMPTPHLHLYEIRMRVAPKGARALDLVLPAWTPGSYLVRDFARHVRDVTARDAKGRPLNVEKVEKARWRITFGENPGGSLLVRYRVYAHELTVRTSHLDATHAYGNGASLFFYVDGRKDEPQALRFVLPKGWKVSVALPRRGGVFRAADYDELVDSPFECGTHRTYTFRVRGVPHTLALWGRGNEDPRRLVRDLTALVKATAKLFGGLPYERYLFIVHLQAGAGGGLEHRASQSVGIEPWTFRPESSYREKVLLVFSHELFHAWNVKRIRPAELGPFDYTKEVYTRDLWAMEGITSYYEVLLPVRALLMTPEQGFEEWCRRLKAHRDNPGSRVQSAEMASFDTWIRLYHPDENSPNVAESYYRRGALVGLALDLTIRRATSGRRSLDDVLRFLDRTFAAKGRGYPPGGFEKAVARVLGRDPKAFFDRYVRGVKTPNVAALLRSFGLELREKPERHLDGKEPARARVAADFGWKTKLENGRLVVSEVWAARPAYEAGIAPGDELVALDGVKTDEETLKRIERDGVRGQRVEIAVFRRGRLSVVPLVLGSRRSFTYGIEPRAEPDRHARSLYRGWLGRPFVKRKPER